MIFDITRSEFQSGYVTSLGVGPYKPYFPTANAAFRRAALEKVGGFDASCRTAEDVDVAIRLANAGYELWYESSAKVLHYPRATLGGMLRQWYSYGLGHALLIKKHSPKHLLQIMCHDYPKEEQTGLRMVARLPFFVSGLVFVSSLLLMHLAAASAAVAWLLGSKWLAISGAALAAIMAVVYFHRCWQVKGLRRALAFSAMRYLVEISFVLGGLVGGLRHGVILVAATRPALDKKSVWKSEQTR